MKDFLFLVVVLLAGAVFVMLSLWVLTHLMEKYRKRVEYSQPLRIYPSLDPVQMESLDTHAMDLGVPHLKLTNETGTWGYWFFEYCKSCGMREGKSCPCSGRNVHLRKISSTSRQG